MVAIVGLHHEVWHTAGRCLWFLLLLCSLLLSLVSTKFFLVSWLLKILSVVFLILLLSNSQLMLNLGNQGSNFLFRYFILLQNMRMFLKQLFSGLVGVGMQDQFLQQYSVDLLLGIWCSLLVVNAYYWGLISHAETFVFRDVPRYTIPPSLIVWNLNQLNIYHVRDLTLALKQTWKRWLAESTSSQ